MKQIIDNETGEVLEVLDENEKAELKLVEVGAIDKETYEVLENYLYYQEQYETFKYKLEKAMRENGIKKWDNEYFTATTVEATTQNRVDTEKLKNDGLYNKYLKEISVKAKLVIKFKDQRKA